MIRRILIPVAAAVLVGFVSGFYLNIHIKRDKTLPENLVYNEVSVPLGARSKILLSDGTIVWLNADSRLSYPDNFMRETREVELEGEAYFNVTKMRNKIFVVKTSDVNVKVYGTEFNIKSYPEENAIQTTLVKGSLAVELIHSKESDKPFYLKPNQSLTFYKTAPEESLPEDIKVSVLSTQQKQTSVSPKIVKMPLVDPVPITSWKDNKWVFVGEELDHLVIKLERRYNVKITFQNESLKKYKFSGTLKDETFEQVLKIIKISAPILYTVVENNVTLYEDPSFRKKYDSLIKNPN